MISVIHLRVISLVTHKPFLIYTASLGLLTYITLCNRTNITTKPLALFFYRAVLASA